MTTNFCVVGSPISHSLSPVLHRAAHKLLGLDSSYFAHEVARGGLLDFLNSQNLTGVSVTMPLKKEAFDLSVETSEGANLTGVVNTLHKTERGWVGSNTDVYGLGQALASVSPPQQTVIIGSGATTTSALLTISALFPQTELQILARDEVSVAHQVSFAKSLGLSASGGAVTLENICGAQLALSLVPAGSFAEVWDRISVLEKKPAGWLFDVSYQPWPSEIAKAWGSPRVISGLEMLIWQAVEQVEIFTAGLRREVAFDRRAMYEVMSAAVSPK